jgi:riboflavin kinase/FMN adenylyltransferase
VRLFRDLDDLSESVRGGAVAIGNFDGVHRGHACLAGALVARAQRVDGPAVVFTFDPHPVCVLRPNEAPPPLSSARRKAELFGALGVDALIAYPTDESLLRLDAGQFFEQIVRGRLDARALVEGPDFRFGRGRQGTIDTLVRLCRDAGIALEVVEPVEWDGHVVSSSRVRALLARGDVAAANRLLTEPYRLRGTVIHGAGRGNGLGFPTANLGRIDTIVPADGIYAGRALVDDGAWPAAISVGPNPTFDEGGRKLEVYLVDYNGNLYDRTIEVDFLARLRDIVRFATIDDLVAQMNRDVEATLQIAVP